MRTRFMPSEFVVDWFLGSPHTIVLETINARNHATCAICFIVWVSFMLEWGNGRGQPPVEKRPAYLGPTLRNP